MRSSRRVLSLLSLIVVTTPALAAPPAFKEGEWGTRYRMEVVGAPFPMPPITVRKTACLTRSNFVPDNSQQGQDCQVRDTKVTGNTVTWVMHCKTREGAIEGHGKITYKGDRYDGVMETRLISKDGSAMPMTYRYTMEGERLGACK
jgi:hypothetical protein